MPELTSKIPLISAGANLSALVSPCACGAYQWVKPHSKTVPFHAQDPGGASIEYRGPTGAPVFTLAAIVGRTRTRWTLFRVEEYWMNESIAAIGTVLSALFAAIAAVLSYIQIRTNSQAECIPSLNIVGDKEVTLRVQNRGGTAKHLSIKYGKVSGPEVIQLRSVEVALRNGIDILSNGDFREFAIAEIVNRDYFLQDHQMLALGVGTETIPGLTGFEEPVVIRIDLRWQEPGIFWHRGDRFDLLVDRPLLDRSSRAQIFPS